MFRYCEQLVQMDCTSVYTTVHLTLPSHTCGAHAIIPTWSFDVILEPVNCYDGLCFLFTIYMLLFGYL